MPIVSAAEWEAFLQHHPDAHLLQSSAWGALKDAFGWSPVYLRAGECGAQVLFRRLPLGFSVAYLPKGPVGADWQALLPELDRACRQRRAIFLRIEPDAWEEEAESIAARLPGFRPSHPVQPQRTILISLEGQPQDWLERMKQKTRYNVRLAQKKEISVTPSADLDGFHQLMLRTGQRDGFGVHSADYYRRAYELFHARGQCELLCAAFEGRPLAMLMVFAQGSRAWYFYGASSDEERNRMPTYLLQFEAMRWAAARGCQEYDLWGIPDVEENALEGEFANRSDGLWGVYRFKRGFGGEVRRSAGAWEKVYNPLLHRLYQFYAARRAAEGG
jgi:lipid II:glycine glycyltransferase (peptidoglycan interpeptide bridge formation enzyme)